MYSKIRGNFSTKYKAIDMMLSKESSMKSLKLVMIEKLNCIPENVN